MSVSANAGESGKPRPPRLIPASGTSRSRRIADRLFGMSVTGGGVAIILGILGILVFIVVETWPLLFSADVVAGERLEIEGLPAGAVVSDEYRESIVHLGIDARVRTISVEGGGTIEATGAGELLEPTVELSSLGAIRVVPGTQAFVADAGRGRVFHLPVGHVTSYDASQNRIVTPRLRQPALVDFGEDLVGGSDLRLRSFAVRRGEDTLTAAAQVIGGDLIVIHEEAEENPFSGEITRVAERGAVEAPAEAILLELSADGRMLFGALEGGRLALWRLDQGRAEPSFVTEPGDSPVTAITLLIGDRSLIVGRESGRIETWFPLRSEQGDFRLHFIRSFDGQSGAVQHLTPSRRGKGFLALDGDRIAGLYHNTSERTLWTGRLDVESPSSIFFAPRANGAFVAGDGGLLPLEIDNPHPDVSWTSLFGKVWYEGYQEPDYVWQSSSGSDDFEPKTSLVPLIFGTLKGTIYSLLLAIPIGVFGAMYTSEFMNPRFKRIVKPTVEIMAALPSVVLGFLAGLWLAPRLDRFFPALMIGSVLLPAAVVMTGLLWYRLPGRMRNRLPGGFEVVIYGLVIGATLWLCIELANPIELAMFEGSFTGWLYDTFALTYDQRNAIVIGLAMGFAVIPIIFSVAEDAFSNVPRSLVAGSLALGASRWQTVTQVVLPTASPGIFSAIMIGFGRAVGETMIVLMATGNTPIMDWSPFNGFRTLSANIAVEIPEAPQGETLYRTLFLSALLLFMLTFLINTAAEVVRDRLRKRYANL